MKVVTPFCLRSGNPRGVSWATLLILLFILALITRLSAVFLFPAIPVADAVDYHRLAAALVEGRGYVAENGALTAWRPPGYPFFLYTLYSLVGVNANAAYYAQAVLGAASVLLLVALGVATLGKAQGLIGGLIAAVYPSLFWLPRVLLSENLSLPLLIAALCFTALLTKKIFWWAALMLGVLLGLAAIVRGANLITAALIIVGLSLTFWRARCSRRTCILSLSLIIFGMLAVLLPWTARNFVVFHRVVPLATQEGMALYASYWPPLNGPRRIWGNLPGTEDEVVATAYRAGDEVETSRYFQRIAWQRLLEKPFYFFELWPSKVISMAAPFDWEWFPHRLGTTRSLNFGYLLILLPSFAGAFILFLRQPFERVWPLAVLPASVIIQTLIFYGSPRFRLPAELVALLLAPVGLEWVCGFWRRRTATTSNVI